MTKDRSLLSQHKARRELTERSVYGPMLNAIQNMWDEHNERAQGVCGCSACATAVAFSEAVTGCGESKR